VYALYSLFASCIYVDLMPAGRFPTISWKIELHGLIKCAPLQHMPEMNWIDRIRTFRMFRNRNALRRS
jgi:hypothetical protein